MGDVFMYLLSLKYSTMEVPEWSGATLVACVGNLPKSYGGFRPDDGAALWRRLEEFPFGGLPTWHASQVWERLTGATTVVTPEVLVAHLREALSILETLGADTDRSLSMEAVYKMAKQLQEARMPGGEGADAAIPSFEWQETKMKLPERLVALSKAVDPLTDPAIRRKHTKMVPHFDGIEQMPVNNAPHPPAGDSEKSAYDKQIRMVMRVLATLTMSPTHDR